MLFVTSLLSPPCKMIEETKYLSILIKNLFFKSTVVEVKGRLVGIIGYVTRSTEYNFPLHEVGKMSLVQMSLDKMSRDQQNTTFLFTRWEKCYSFKCHLIKCHSLKCHSLKCHLINKIQLPSSRGEKIFTPIHLYLYVNISLCKYKFPLHEVKKIWPCWDDKTDVFMSRWLLGTKSRRCRRKQGLWGREESRSSLLSATPVTKLTR